MASKYDALIDEVTSGTPEPVTSNTEKYGAIIDEVTSTAPLHNSLFGASGVNPDEEARKVQLSKELNTPAGILPADAEQQAQFKKLNADTIQQKTPATAKFLTKEENAKLTGLKGVDSLTKLEETYKTYSPTNIKKFIDNYTATGKTAAEASQRLTEMKAKGVNLADELDPYARSGADVVPDVLKATAGVINTAVAGVGELAKINPTNLAIEKLFGAISPAYAEQSRKQFNSVQGTLNENAEYWQNQKSPAVQKLNKEFEQAGIADSVSLLIAHPALAADMILPSSIYALPGAGVARLGAGATSVAGYKALVEAGDAANTARQEAIAAGATPEQQDKAAAAAAIVTAPLAFLGNKLTGIGKLEASFFTTGRLGDSLLKAVVKEAVSGAIEEGPNKFGTNVGATVYDENRQLLEGVGKAAVIGGVLESTHAVGMSAAERALRTFVKDIEQTTSNKGVADSMAAQATAAHDTIETLGAQVADNELRARSPEAFKEFVETMVDDQELQDVYVDGKTMLEAIDADFVALKQQVPELVARIEEAANLGNDVQIPVSDYLTYIAGTPSEANVFGALKAEPSGATYKEAQDFYKSQADLFQSEVQAVADANEEVLTRDEFVAQKSLPQENQPVTEGTESTTSALPNTYEEYLAQHKNTREVYARDVDGVEETLYNQFAEAKRFTPSVNRAYVAPLVEFYKNQAKKFGTLPSALYKQYPLKIQAFLNLVPGFELSQTRNAAVTDFTPENLPDLLSRDIAVFEPTQIKSAMGNNGNFNPNDPNILNQSIYYSALTRAVSELKQGKASAAQWKGMIKNLPGIKQDEVEAVGLNEWLDLQTGSVTKEALMNYLDANGVEVTEVELGTVYTQEDENTLAELEDREPVIVSEGATGEPTKYRTYVVGGADAGSNYREILLTLPTNTRERDAAIANLAAYRESLFAKYGVDSMSKLTAVYTADEDLEFDRLLDERSKADPTSVNYKSSHWSEANILAHVRVDERQDPDGKRVLFVNEIQSDFGQEFKKSKNSINAAVDSDFNGIIERMKAAGVLEVNCD